MTDVVTDKRELILARLLEALKAIQVPAFSVVARNKDEVADSAKPAIVIVDGNEVVADDDDQRGHRPSNATVLVDMTPEIVCLVDADSQETIGTEMNKVRSAILKAIVLDAELLAIVGTNGKIRYEGMETVLATGRRIEGQVLLKITFRYPLVYANL